MSSENEIIKALQCCITPAPLRCNKCTYLGNSFSCRSTDLKKDALDLINRQKAEIEELNEKISTQNNFIEWHGNVCLKQQAEIERIRALTRKVYDTELAEAKSEAVKEFAERLKNQATMTFICNHGNGTKEITGYQFSPSTIDYLVKEMVGDTE